MQIQVEWVYTHPDMLIFGKLIGAIVGSFIQFPFGTMLGLWIGHIFDRGLQMSVQNLYLGNNDWTKAKAQKSFFNATFQMIGYIAKMDGRVSEREIAMAESLMDRMRLSKELRREAINLFNHGKSSAFDIGKVLADLKHNCGNNAVLLQLFIDILQQAAFADGFSLKKQNVIAQIAANLGIKGFKFQQQQQQHRHYQQQSSREPQTEPPKENPYKTLGVKQSDDYQTIKRAYRKLMSQNHPDKLVSQGLPPEMIKLATEKTQKIQKAYDFICKERQFRK